MALSENKVSVQNFTGGLNTDFHELNVPQGTEGANFTVDEENCDINRKGFRQRRMGITYEAGYAQNATQYAPATMDTQYIKAYRWDNVNNTGTRNFLVVQTGATLSFYDLSITPVSAGLKSFTVNLASYAAPGVTDTTTDGISVASGNGALFVVGRLINPFYITYSVGSDSITVTLINIKIRDLIEQDATAANDAQLSTLTIGRQYDLFNQGWNTSQVRLYYSTVGPTVEAGSETVLQYYFQVKGYYPPKTAPWWVGKRIGDKGVEVFDPQQYNSVSSGNSLGALGHYIVDAFKVDRSTASGIAGIPITTITDRPTAVAFFAGKVFYLLGNTVYYSQTITDASDMSGVGKCYQDADPTAEQLNDLIATDGGTITIPQSAVGQALFVIENCLIAFSSNGTWLISGQSTNSGFSATDYSINKISDVSCTSARTIINADGVPIWWAPQGIFTLEPISTKQSFSVKNISLKRVQNFYDSIVPLAHQNATGCFDHILKRCIWLFSSNPSQSSTNTRFEYNDVLILDLLFNAYVHYTISDYPNLQPSKLVDVFNIQPVQSVTTLTVVTDNLGNPVTTAAGDVTTNINSLINTTTVTKDTEYMVIGPVGVVNPTGSTNETIAFADFTSCDLLDWSDYTTVGVGADYVSYLDVAYTIAGYMTPHFTPAYDAMMWMYSPYIYVFLEQPARACQTTVITIPGQPPGLTTNKLLAYNVTDSETYTDRGILVDFVNNFVYRFGTTPSTNGLLRKFDGLTTGNEIAFTDGNTLGYSLLSENSEKCVTFGGTLVFYAGNNGEPVIAVDPTTLTVIGTCPTSGVPPSAGHVSTPWNMAPLRYGTTDFVISTAQHFSAVGKWVSAIAIPAMTAVTIGPTDEDGSPIVCRGSIGTTAGTAIVVGQPETFTGGNSIGVYLVTGNASGFSMVKKATLVPSAIDATWTNYTSLDGVCYDQTDGNPIVMVSDTSAGSGHKHWLAKITLSTGAVAWTSAISTPFDSINTLGQANIVSQVLYYMDSSNLLRIINTSDGSQTTQTLTTMGQSSTQISDDVSTSIVLGQANWTETSPTPTYFGTYFTGGGSHVLVNKDARWFVGGITTPGTPNTYIYEEEALPNASSCMLQTAWDWASSSASKKWAQKVETYRYRANFFVATSKNKVRGKGKTLQARFSSTTSKDFQLLGWGIWYTKNQHP